MSATDNACVVFALTIELGHFILAWLGFPLDVPACLRTFRPAHDAWFCTFRP